MRKNGISLSLFVAVAALVVGTAGLYVLAGEKAEETKPAAEENHWWVGLGLGAIPEPVRAQLSVQQVPEDSGVWVSLVAEKSPAEQAEIQPYDVLAKINGTSVQTAQDVIDVVKDSNGKALAFEVVRAGEVKKLAVTPIATPEDVKAARRLQQRQRNGSLEYGKPLEMDLPDEFRGIFEEMQKQMRRGQIQIDGDVFDGEVEDLTEEPEVNGSVTKALPAPQGMSFQRQLRSMVNGKSLSISVNKQGDAPAKIEVDWDGKKYETTEDQLDVIPEEIRDKVRDFSESGIFRSDSSVPVPSEENNEDPKQMELDQSKVRDLN